MPRTPQLASQHVSAQQATPPLVVVQRRAAATEPDQEADQEADQRRTLQSTRNEDDSAMVSGFFSELDSARRERLVSQRTALEAAGLVRDSREEAIKATVAERVAQQGRETHESLRFVMESSVESLRAQGMADAQTARDLRDQERRENTTQREHAAKANADLVREQLNAATRQNDVLRSEHLKALVPERHFDVTVASLYMLLLIYDNSIILVVLPPTFTTLPSHTGNF